MELKMFAFGEEEGCIYYICAEDKDKAKNVYKTHVGSEIFEEVSQGYGSEDDWIREMDMDENFTYYPDGKTPEENSIRNHLRKYCTTPNVFACSEF
ncbi:hypothetical protein K7T73_12745 [Bacillus badius]|uniref:hypothetical protein n=1 Tax=Bacillus badius TaxID=1455 RepID=UPI001CC032D2|nr:hypothetical protein [Bacillus badius]UAT29468.1 hypothetical protein K7T73_12745 [Bacillus badius]